MAKIFHNYLKSLRENKNLSQSQLADAANGKGDKKVTQSVLVQYEAGNVNLPDPEVLKQIAEVLEVGYGQFALRVAIDQVDTYKSAGDFDAREDTCFNIWQTALELSTSQTDGSPGLKSWQEFMRDLDLYDLDQLAEWQSNFENLKVFWVIAPGFIDNANPKIRDAVLSNVGKQAHYFYFVREGDDEEGGPFYVLKDSLKFLGQQRDEPIPPEYVDDYVHAVTFPKKVAGLLPSDIVVANPQSTDAAGFRSIRRKGVPAFGVPLDEAELSRLCSNYLSYFGVENVFPKAIRKNPK